MTLIGLALRMLWGRALVVTLTALSVALGLGLVSSTLAVSAAARGAAREIATRYPLVVGPKIGAVPLVLGALTSLQQLEGGIDADIFEQLSVDQRVQKVVPILSGHATSTFAVVGTTAHYFEPRPRFRLAAGRLFEPGSREAVIGHDVARSLGKSPGDMLELEHRHAVAGEHAAYTLRIVGVLDPRGDDTDKTTFCPVEAVHESHDHGPRRLSALLVVPRDEAALLSLQEDLTIRPDLDVALSAQTLRRIADQLAAPGDLVRLLAGGVTLVTLLSLACGVYIIALQGSREIGVLRLLGARRLDGAIVASLMGGALLIAALGGAVLVASGLGRAAEQALRQEMGLDATVNILSADTAALFGLAGAVLLAMMLLPAIGVYRMAPLEAQAVGSGGNAMRRLRRAVRPAVLTLVVVVVMVQLTIQSGPSSRAVPLDPTSSEVFSQLSRWKDGTDRAPIPLLNDTTVTLMGYMYAVGEPFEAEHFYLVGQDPRLAHCPFCYRAPTRQERILVMSPGKPRELSKGPVRVRGVLRVLPTAADPITLTADRFEVVIDQRDSLR